MAQVSHAAKNWCFTLNNYCLNDLEKLRRMYEHGHFNYLLFGFETCPTTGTPHLQGYLQLNKKLRLKQVKSLISPRVHLENQARRASVLSNQIYCKKSGEFEEYGTPVHKAGNCLNFKLLFLSYPE